MTHEDICNAFRGDTLLAVLAPAGTMLEVAPPEMVSFTECNKTAIVPASILALPCQKMRKEELCLTVTNTCAALFGSIRKLNVQLCYLIALWDFANLMCVLIRTVKQGCPSFFSLGAKTDNLKWPVGQRHWKSAGGPDFGYACCKAFKKSLRWWALAVFLWLPHNKYKHSFFPLG